MWKTLYTHEKYKSVRAVILAPQFLDLDIMLPLTQESVSFLTQLSSVTNDFFQYVGINRAKRQMN